MIHNQNANIFITNIYIPVQTGEQSYFIILEPYKNLNLFQTKF